MALEGRVTADGREAVISLEMLGGSGRRARIEAVVDTGFTGYLTLPADLRRPWPSPHGVPATWCSRTVAWWTSTSTARVVWHGRERPVAVLETEGGPLIGMSLLRGSELRLRAVGGGEVIVEELLR